MDIRGRVYVLCRRITLTALTGVIGNLDGTRGIQIYAMGVSSLSTRTDGRGTLLEQAEWYTVLKYRSRETAA